MIIVMAKIVLKSQGVACAHPAPALQPKGFVDLGVDVGHPPPPQLLAPQATQPACRRVGIATGTVEARIEARGPRRTLRC
jgi:hypothetical protein